MTPCVSVIITTHARPHLVCNAVRSTLAQTLKNIEVIVVLDGPDPATEQALAVIGDDRMRVLVRDSQGGQPAAINSGIALARGEWTALLDDDDEWFPAKLDIQLQAALSAATTTSPIVGCRFTARRNSGDVVWPRRIPRPNEPLCEYLFCRRSITFGEGILPTSVLLAPTALFRDLPMNEQLRNHCDLDWLIRAASAGAKLVMPAVTAPLALWQTQQDRTRLSNAHDWRFSYEWMKRSRPLVTARAFAGFLLTWVSHSALCQRDSNAFGFLLRQAVRHGRPSFLEMVIHVVTWALPRRARQTFSAGLARRSGRDFAAGVSV